MKKNHKEKIENVASELLKKAGIKHKIKSLEEEDVLYVNIETEDSALLIGQRGETLSSLEHIIKILSQKCFEKDEEYPRFIVDVCGYRKNQTIRIEDSAHITAEKVMRTMEPEVLHPMNAYERRIVHLALVKYDKIDTESVGEEPNRRIIIKLKHENL